MMNGSGASQDVSEGGRPFLQSVQPILDNTLRFFDAESTELVLSESARVFFLSEPSASPVQEELHRTSFATNVMQEEGVVEGEPDMVEEKLCDRHSGSSDSINWTAGAPVYTDNGRPAGAVVVLGSRASSLTVPEQEYLKNVSKQINSQLSQSDGPPGNMANRDVHEMVLQEAYQFMGLISPEGELIFSNQSSLERFDLQLEEVTGVSFWETPWFDHSEELQKDIRKAIDTAREGEFVQREVQTISPEGGPLWVDFSITPVEGPDGDVRHLVVEGRDISDRVAIERELKQSSVHLRAIQEHAPVGISLTDDSGTVLSWNPACEEIFDMSREEAIGETHPFFSNVNDHNIQEELESVRNGEAVKSRESQFEKPSGERIALQYSLKPVLDESGSAGRIVEIFDDVTEVRRTEKQLLEQERIFQKLVENIREAFYLVTADAEELLYLSPGIEEIWGRPVEEMQEDRWVWLESIHEDDRERVRKEVEKQPDEPLDVKYRVVQPDGTVRWVHDTNYVIEDEQGEPTLMGGICDDITEQRAVKENLEKSLEEKETLLEELHHRVKNNLQIITSLMNLQLSDLPESAQHAVRGLISQVHAIASLHETVHDSNHINQLNPETYINEITRRLTSIYGKEQVDIELDVSDADGVLDLKRAVPCGLIINELVANAFQHAFDDKTGRIVIRLIRADDTGEAGETMYKLCVTDNGTGLPESVDIGNPKQFGLQLVQMMGEGELNGACSVTVDEGTEFCITFPVEEEKE